jgi:hypothetical protein
MDSVTLFSGLLSQAQSDYAQKSALLRNFPRVQLKLALHLARCIAFDMGWDHVSMAELAFDIRNP